MSRRSQILLLTLGDSAPKTEPRDADCGGDTTSTIRCGVAPGVLVGEKADGSPVSRSVRRERRSVRAADLLLHRPARGDARVRQQAVRPERLRVRSGAKVR